MYSVDDKETQGVNPVSTVAEVPITEEGALQLVYEICHASQGYIIYASSVMCNIGGIVHREIKPKNFMLSDDHVVIIDFGFADFGNHAIPDDGDGKSGRTLRIAEIGNIKGEVQLPMMLHSITVAPRAIGTRLEKPCSMFCSKDQEVEEVRLILEKEKSPWRYPS